MIFAGFLSGWTAAARSALGAIRGAVKMAWDAARTVMGLEKAGITIEETEVDKVMERIREQELWAEMIGEPDKDNYFSPSDLPFAITPIRSLYSFNVKVTGIDILTDKEGVRYVRVTSDKLMTYDAIIQRGINMVKSKPDEYKFQPLSGEIESGMRANPTIGTL